ncbi:hypothetical protein [Paraburkholderia sp. FT54]|uniref:hypothetical protein n=1 Tax=Paraburkholderia sp. FT54 TaxID=3074437 RepID=UPI0038F7F2E6
MAITSGIRPAHSEPDADELARRNVMRKSILKIMLGCAAALSVASGAALAQGGGNGQGGSGGGNAHSAATAGMTRWGDPVSNPLDPMPGTTMKNMDSANGNPPPMSPGDPMNPPKTAQ